MDGIHDMGAMHGFGPVPVDETGHGPDWGARLQAVAILAGGGLRAGIEEIDPGVYLTSGYHEKWVLCSEQRQVQRDKVSASDLERWRTRLEADPDVELPRAENPENTARIERKLMATPLLHPVDSPTFAVGDRVRVAPMRAESHHRCPRYVRGVVGLVEAVPGADYRPDMPRTEDALEPVYTVLFESSDLWGAEGSAPSHQLMIDLWQSYLEAP